jgi:4-amino-4-deoxy-L-arabinose transferase-like glycosyltransferase
MSRPLLLVLLVAAIWRVTLLISILDTPLGAQEMWDQSDMSTFVRQADRIADGDWLVRRPLYPYHGWMFAVPVEEWNRWHSPAMFYQPPLYSYGLAILMKLGLDAPLSARWLQVALGVFACGLMFGLTSRLFGRAVATVAGLMQAVYGPLLISESQLLRDGPILAWTLLVLFLTVDTLPRLRRTGADGDWRRRGWLIGLLLGMQAMLHEAAVFLFIPILLWGVWNARRRHVARALQWAALLAFGALVGYSPMLARNVALGEPAPPRYFGSSLAFATANHPDIPDGTLTNSLPRDRERFSAAMREAQGSPARLVASIARDYDGDHLRWARRWGLRLLALAIGPESHENLCYAYFRREVPILSFAIDFRFVLPLALTGAFLLGRRRRQARLGGGLGLILVSGLALFVLISAVHPFGRYRLILLPLLLPPAAFASIKIWLAIRRRAFGRLAAIVGGVFALAIAQYAIALIPPLNQLGGLRPADFQNSSKLLAQWGWPEAAAEHLREGFALFPDAERIPIDLALAEGMDRHGRGDYTGAIEAWTRALALDPDNPLARLGLATALENRPLQSAAE